MLYIEDISALRYWLSTARVVHNGRRLRPLSALENCPRNSRDSSWHTLDDLAYDFREKPTLAVPGAEFRVQRKRFDYHVWSGGIPPASFLKVSEDIAVARPALAVAQTSGRLCREHLCQIICLLAGSYITPPGKRAGILDKLEPILTIEELWDMAEQLKGQYSTKRLKAALPYVAENSASPQETDLLLLCTLTKNRGGLSTRGWNMNVEMEVPFNLRRYLGQKTITPDLLSEKHSLILEYDSDEDHSTPEQRQIDEKRRVVFNLMGYKVIPVYTQHMRGADQFEPIATSVLETFGRKRIISSPEQLAAREKLLRTLRSNPLLF